MEQKRRGFTLTCKHCGKEFYVPPSRLKYSVAEYCSMRCYYDDPNPTKPRKTTYGSCKCEHCGKEYIYIPNKNGKRFCSPECRYAHWKGEQHPRYSKEHWVIRVCPVCKKGFQRPRAWMKYKTAYCSKECMNKDMETFTGATAYHWKGGYDPYYGPNWLGQRRKARHRDGYKCRVCGVSEIELAHQLCVHHIRPFRTFKKDWRSANKLSNLVSLCRLCHGRVEHGRVSLPPPP